eukprot:scaffold5365_cov115-Isochrysis_galbana.AAC.13
MAGFFSISAAAATSASVTIGSVRLISEMVFFSCSMANTLSDLSFTRDTRNLVNILRRYEPGPSFFRKVLHHGGREVCDQTFHLALVKTLGLDGRESCGGDESDSDARTAQIVHDARPCRLRGGRWHVDDLLPLLPRPREAANSRVLREQFDLHMALRHVASRHAQDRSCSGTPCWDLKRRKANQGRAAAGRDSKHERDRGPHETARSACWGFILRLVKRPLAWDLAERCAGLRLTACLRSVEECGVCLCQKGAGLAPRHSVAGGWPRAAANGLPQRQPASQRQRPPNAASGCAGRAAHSCTRALPAARAASESSLSVLWFGPACACGRASRLAVGTSRLAVPMRVAIPLVPAASASHEATARPAVDQISSSKYR